MAAPQDVLSGFLHHIPNVISGLRIAAFPLLLALVWFKQREAFSWVLAVALLSDILDGAIARHFYASN